MPSLVDARARLNREVKVCDFLGFAAREREYQVTDLVISKSPRVESLASGFSTRILPVLTHARQTAVHGQLRQLAEFVLTRAPPLRRLLSCPWPLRRRPGCGTAWSLHCPVCAERALDDEGHLFFDLRSRRRGLLHPECLDGVLRNSTLELAADPDSLLVLELAGPGMLDEAADLQLHLFDAQDRLMASEQVAGPEHGRFPGDDRGSDRA